MKPTHIHAEVLEHEARLQFESAMREPFSLAGALMPDAHTGYSLPIGAVVLTDNVIVPAWVGYDIGCGMLAAPLNIVPDLITKHQDDLFNEIYRRTPVGFNHHKKVQTENTKNLSDTMPFTPFLKKVYTDENADKQLGSLGSGNHFIEIGYDETSQVWIIIHSGSRNLGHKTATHYMKLAADSDKPKEGHYGFHKRDPRFAEYHIDMEFCLSFALLNRKTILNQVIAAISSVTGLPLSYDHSRLINRTHNHARIQTESVLHRKGATEAEIGMFGVIPGNMLDGSFIVRGLGNPDFLCSSSHGAGRVMSRSKAKKTVDIADFQQIMSEIKAKVDQSTLDESPFAYKNIFDVMEAQRNSVEVIHHVKPLINIKG